MSRPTWLLLCLALAAAPAAAQIDPRTALLEKAGWDALTAGNARAAADAFRGALAGDPRNARLYFGAGTAAYLERRDEDARRDLERALELDPKLADARMVLGRVQYRSGDLPGAIRTYERLTADRPGDAASVDALERWR